MPGFAFADLRRERFNHADIVAGLEFLGHNQRANANLVERIFGLTQAIGRIDRHQDQAGAGGRKLRKYPFRAIGRPDADAIAGLQS